MVLASLELGCEGIREGLKRHGLGIKCNRCERLKEFSLQKGRLMVDKTDKIMRGLDRERLCLSEQETERRSHV